MKNEELRHCEGEGRRGIDSRSLFHTGRIGHAEGLPSATRTPIVGAINHQSSIINRPSSIINLLAFLCVVLILLSSCRKEEDEFVLPSDEVPVNPSETVTDGICGFFLLNEGNMGSNKASLDYYDYTTGTYTRNIFGERNPDEVKDLGDVGNDLKIYGSKLWAVINCSNYVEVMDVSTARHLAKIPIANCRYLAFKDKYAYVSAYAGPVQIDPDARIGLVAKIDTATLEVVKTCTVGYQPEEMAVVGNKLYVANSGGYRVPNYDRTVSVIDLETFTEVKKIDVAINLHRLRPDSYGRLYVSSRGDYYGTPSNVYVIDTSTDEVTGQFDLQCNNMTVCGDSLYLLGSDFSYATGSWGDPMYAVVDTETQTVLTRQFITDGTDGKIKTPYGLAVHPANGEFFVTDAKDYVSPGTLHCFTPEGKLKWSVTTGDIPCSIAFTRQPLRPLE